MFIVTIKRDGLAVNASKEISLPVTMVLPLTAPAGYWSKKTLTGYQGLTAYCPGPWIQDPGPWILDPGLWIQDPGPWILNPGLWIRIQDPGS